MSVELVVAYSSNRVIGDHGRLPWHLPSDLRHFRELTLGGTVVMGRRTFESIPARFRPLPGRRNLVLSRRPGYAAPGAEVFPELALALAAAGPRCFVIGGSSVYRDALGVATRIHATEIAAVMEGDTCFPTLAPEEWRCVAESEPVWEDGLRFVRRIYERRT